MYEHPRIYPTLLLIVLTTLLSGCASRSQKWTGPAQPERVVVNAWSQRPAPASVLNSPRYTIYTTLPNGARRKALPQVMEGAYAQYQAIAPAKLVDDRPMHCFVFAERKEWEEFTSRRTGEDALRPAGGAGPGQRREAGGPVPEPGVHLPADVHGALGVPRRADSLA